MAKVVVEHEFDSKTGQWTARVNGQTVQGRTPRIVRSDAERLVGGKAEVEHRVKEKAPRQKQLDACLKHAEQVEKLRYAYQVELDKLNVERLNLIEAMLEEKYTMEMIADKLRIFPGRVQQIADARHYAGARTRALRDGTLKPGTPPQRTPKSGGGDDD